MLDNISYIAKRLKNSIYENYSIKGKLCNLSQDDINNISLISNYVEEYTDLDGNDITYDKLSNFIDKNIEIQISTGDIKGYFDTFSSFLIKNKIELLEPEFYIRDMDCLYKRGDECDSEKLDLYFKNIKIIKLLRKIADYEKKVGNDLELFFYKAENGLVLKIDYNENDLNNFTINKLNELNNHFFEKPDKEERKQIFINDLISLLNEDNSYSSLLKKWNTLQCNYDKSFKLYLSGFSFEKIKTSTTGHFQELTDRIYHQINKATINIFVVPSAYIFFIRSFDVSGNTLQNGLLFITTFIFSLIMHKVIFNNMTEGLASVGKDIKKFRSKTNITLLAEINDELEELESKNLKKQRNKIKLLKWSNWVLFLFACTMFLYIEYTVIIWLFNLIFEKL